MQCHFKNIIPIFEIKCAHIKLGKLFKTLFVSICMVKYVCYDILELEMFG